jgi:hypothetical protein
MRAHVVWLILDADKSALSAPNRQGGSLRLSKKATWLRKFCLQILWSSSLRRIVEGPAAHESLLRSRLRPT